jgi:enterochelin esterase-like enzyme
LPEEVGENMKKINGLIRSAFVIVLIIFILSLGGFKNKQTTKVDLYSQSLKKDMKINIYLPSGYSEKNKYTVLYVLHGKDANEDSWMNGFFGINGLHIDNISNQLISERKIKPMIIVSPEIDNSYGINSSKKTFSQNGYSEGMYQDYLLKEVVPYIDSHYSTIHSRDGRYISGFSMGGFTALHNAFEYPETFSKVGTLSAAIWEGKYPKGLKELSWVYPNQTAREHLDPLILAKNNNIQSVNVFLDNDDTDMDWIETTNRALFHELKQENVKVQYHVGHGGHDYGYWSTRVEDLLLFFGADKSGSK